MWLGAASCLYQVLGQSGDVMLLPSTDPLRAGHGEKVKGREGTLVLGCTNTFELLGWRVTSCPCGWGINFPALPQHRLSPQLNEGRE